MKMFLFPFLALFMAAFTRHSSPVVAPAAPGCAAATVAEPAGAASNLLFQSTDGGAHWQDLSAAFPENFEIGTAMVQDGEVWLGGSAGKIFHSADPASGHWQRTNVSGFLPNEQAGTVAELFAGRSGLYACMADGCLFKQITGTSLWYPLHKALVGTWILDVIELPSGRLVIGSHRGVHTSADGGGSWSHMYHKGWVDNFRTEGNLLLADSEKGPLQSADGGTTWTFAPVLEPLCLAPGKPVFDHVQVGSTRYCSHEGGISCSTNNGKSWKLVQSMAGLGENPRLKLVVLGQTVFAVKVRGGC